MAFIIDSASFFFYTVIARFFNFQGYADDDRFANEKTESYILRRSGVIISYQIETW